MFDEGQRLMLIPFRNTKKVLQNHHHKAALNEIFIENVTYVRECFGNALIIDCSGRKRLCSMDDLKAR